MPSLTLAPVILRPSPRTSVMRRRPPAPGAFAFPNAARAPLRIVAFLAIALLTAACSGRSLGTGTPDLPPACDAFVTKYEACVKASVPSMPAVAKERAAQTRAALEKEFERASSGTNAPNLTALVTKCQDNLQRLASSCGSSHAN
jgi:hypothetical protein